MKKNFICILLTIAMLLFCNVTTYAQQSQSIKNSPNLSPWKEQVVGGGEDYIVGDVNGDEKVDISDIVAIINIIAKNDKSNQRADVNDDGEIDISDIVKVINIMANPYKPLSINKNSLVLWTREYGSVWINSGNGKYEVTNENPNIVSVEGFFSDWWVSPRKSPSMTEAGQTTISDRKETPEYYDNIDYLEITALQPGSAVVRIKDVLSKQEQSINITVKERVIDDIYPEDYETIEGTSVAFRFTVNHPWTGDLNCRVCLEDWGGEIVKTADITVNGTEGEKTYYNQDGKIITFSDLKPNTAYDWTIYYYDKNESDTIECYSSSLYTEPAPTDISELCPDSNHPHIIDMGEAGKWACCNVGASSPEEAGDMYAWGETAVKSEYDWSNYIHCDGSMETCHDIGNDIAGSAYDVAHVKWGSNWQIPNYSVINSFFKLKSEWTMVNGVPGTKFTSSNGNSVFLPDVDEHRYWSSLLGSYPYCFGSYSTFSYTDKCFVPHLFFGERERCDGLYVRPFYYEDPAVAAGLCPDSKHPHIIDMGEAGKWACCNVGADNPMEYGDYYAWGETETKDDFSWDTYEHCDGDAETCHDIGKDISNTEYDVARVKWGVKWCMFNYDTAKALLDNCNIEETTFNEISGVIFTASNGNRLFLPKYYYWTSTLDLYGSLQYAQTFSLYSNPDFLRLSRTRYARALVRPVLYEDPAVSASLCPDSRHPHIIDMGVAGKWACCNVGANAPWEYGGYYAWGETEEKDNYDWSNYIHCDGSQETCHDIGNDIAGTDYDVAYMKWGGNWCLPTFDQQLLLLDNCTIEWTTVNGINGGKFTAPNGTSIFLPASGYHQNNKMYHVGKWGCFWSSTLDSRYTYSANNIYSTTSAGTGAMSRYCGSPVRPIQSDYTLGFCNVVSPTSGATLEDTSVLFDFSINPLWNGSTIIRIMLSEDPEMKKTSNINYTLNGRVGTPCYHNADISGLNPNTKYYWRMAYYDWDKDTYVYCSPVSWFMTGNE